MGMKLSGGIPMWGVILVIAGLVIILNGILPIKIPVLRIFFGILFVWIGLKILIKGPSHHSFKDFHEKIEKVETEDINKYAIIFGKGDYVFDDIPVKDGSRIKGECVFGQITMDFKKADFEGTSYINVDNAFGQGLIYLPPHTAYSVKASAAFAQVDINKKSVLTGFGERQTIKSENFETADQKVILNLSSVFGELKLITE